MKTLEPIAQSIVDLGWAIRGMVVRGLGDEVIEKGFFAVNADYGEIHRAVLALDELMAMAEGRAMEKKR